MLKHIIFVVVWMLFSGCMQFPVNYAVKEINTKNLISSDTFSLLPDLVEDWHAVPLETTDSSLLIKIREVHLDSNYIFIFSQDDRGYNSKIIVFNKDGKYLNTIGSIGRGPTEYGNIDSWNINTYTKEVVIFDPTSLKIKRYNYNGTYIGCIAVDPKFYRIANFSFCKDGEVLALNRINNEVTSEWLLYSQDFKRNKILSEKNITFKGIANMLIHPQSSLRDSVSIIRYFCDTIYHYSSNRLIPTYYVNIHKTVPENFIFKGENYEELWKIFLRKDYDFRCSIFETDRYLILEQVKKCIVWDKKQEKGIGCDFFRNNKNVIIPTNLLGVFNNYLIGWKDCSSILIDREYRLKLHTETSPK